MSFSSHLVSRVLRYLTLLALVVSVNAGSGCASRPLKGMQKKPDKEMALIATYDKKQVDWYAYNPAWVTRINGIPVSFDTTYQAPPGKVQLVVRYDAEDRRGDFAPFRHYAAGVPQMVEFQAEAGKKYGVQRQRFTTDSPIIREIGSGRLIIPDKLKDLPSTAE